MTSIRTFNPPAVYRDNARSVIDDAYRALGLPTPTVVDPLSEMLAAEPEPHEVATKYAKLSLANNKKPEDLAKRALDEMMRARAAEQFRSMYESIVDQIAYDNIDAIRDRAAKDLAGPFNKLAKQLQHAASRLDNGNPLSRDRAFDLDVTDEWKTVAQVLETFGKLAIHDSLPVGSYYRAPALLALVDVPKVTVAQFVREGNSIAAPYTEIRDEHYPQRSSLRKFLNGSSDPDESLVNVARGRYPGISLALADSNEYRLRIESANNAIMRKRLGS